MVEFNDRRLISKSRTEAKAAGLCGAGYQTSMGGVFSCLRAPGHPTKPVDGIGHSAMSNHAYKR